MADFIRRRRHNMFHDPHRAIHGSLWRGEQNSPSGTYGHLERNMEKTSKVAAASLCLCIVIILSSSFLEKASILTILIMKVLAVGSAIFCIACVAVICMLNFKSELYRRNMNDVRNRLAFEEDSDRTILRHLENSARELEQESHHLMRTQKLRNEIITMFKIRSLVSCIPELQRDARWCNLPLRLSKRKNKTLSIQDNIFPKDESDIRSLILCDTDSIQMQKTNKTGPVSHYLTSDIATNSLGTVDELECLSTDYNILQTREKSVAVHTDYDNMSSHLGETVNIEQPKESQPSGELKSSINLQKLSQKVPNTSKVNRNSLVQNQTDLKSQDLYSENLLYVSESIWNRPYPESSNAISDHPESSNAISDHPEPAVLLEDDNNDYLMNLLNTSKFFNELFGADKDISRKSHRRKPVKPIKLSIDTYSRQ